MHITHIYAQHFYVLCLPAVLKVSFPITRVLFHSPLQQRFVSDNVLGNGDITVNKIKSFPYLIII